MPDERRVKILGALSFLLVLVAFHGGIEAQDGIILELQSEQYSYVVREPVKLIATLRNESTHTIRIPECEEFGMDMQHMYLEVITPERDTQYRRHQCIFYVALENPGYTGEPFSPGESREIFLYPNVTWQFEPSAGRLLGADEVTFPKPGEYHVRVIYDVNPFWQRLWKAPGGLASNSITLDIRKPSSGEKEILDAYWTAGFGDLACGDVNAVVEFDEGRLRKAIAEHENDPLVRYAYFGLGRVLYVIWNRKEKVSEARSVFELIAARFPNFRYEEVQLYLARCYHALHNDSVAVRIMDAALEKSPGLIDNYDFMRERVWFESDFDAVHRWKMDRKRGKDPFRTGGKEEGSSKRR